MKVRPMLVCALAAATLTGCSRTEEPKPQPAQSQAPKVSPQSVAQTISEEWPIPEPTDTTGGCQAKDGDTAPGCVGRLTSDAVTIAEFADEATARRWADEMGKVGDHRPAGRFVLSWTAREQALTSEEARVDMVQTTLRLQGSAG